nr:dipeptidase [Armatimonadota bacterium]
MNAYEVAATHRDEFLDSLKTLLRMPSISALSSHEAEVLRTARWLVEHLEQIGMTRAELFPTGGHPIVYAEWMGAPGAPTVLIYGHYDVQPVDDEGAPEKWRTPPFEPVVQNGNLYGRGTSDDKAQFFCHLKAAESLLKATGKLPVNLKFLIEGEEEISSMHLHPFIEAHQEMLKADTCLISDSHMLASDRPVIAYALRGLLFTEIEVDGPKTELHSGIYGGVVHNPVQALCEIIAGLHKADGSVDVPGFYDQVRLLSPEERAALAEVPWTDEEFRHETGVPAPWGEADFTLRERVGARPTLEVNGMIGGFTGEGPKTVLPARARAKISCRLVADQNPVQMFERLRERVRQLTPPTVTSEIRMLSSGDPAIVELNSPAMEAASRAYQ